MSTNDVIRKLEAEKASLQERIGEINARSALLDSMIAEIREMNRPAKKNATRARRRAPAKAKKSKPAKRARRKAVKAKVSMADAILKLLADSKEGMPAGAITSAVSKAYGHKPNSLRTMLHNLKKKGALVQSEKGAYRWANLSRPETH